MENKFVFVGDMYNKLGCKKINELIEIISSWNFIFNHSLNQYSTPNHLYNETLFIECEPNCILDLMNHKTKIINNINIFFAKKIVKNVILAPKFT